ncbi:MAG: SPOR domain-containing protein [Pseudomonadota bacterium]
MKWILSKSLIASALFLISMHAYAIRVTVPAIVLALDSTTTPAATATLAPATAPAAVSTPAPALVPGPTETLYSLDSALKFHSEATGNYYIQLGCFKTKEHADKLVQDVKFRTDDPVTLVEKNGWFIVTLGPYHSSEDVRAISNVLALFLKANTQSDEAPAETKKVVPVPATAAVEKPVEKPKLAVHHPHKKNKYVKNQYAKYKDHAYIHVKLLRAHGNWYIAGNLGVWAPIVSNTMRVNNGTGFPNPAGLDSYSTNTRWGGSIGLGTGYRWQRDARWLPVYSVGLRYQHLFATNIGQQVTQFSTPEFTNYNYTLNVASDVLLLATKLNLFQLGQILPFINAGVGISFNRVSNYSETPLAGVTGRDTPGFANNSSHGFAYSIGAGLDWRVQSQLIMSLNYEFQGLGSINTRNGVDSWSAVHLHSGTYQSNNVLLSMSYLFDR